MHLVQAARQLIFGTDEHRRDDQVAGLTFT
jgi:hypothetical protein